MGKQVSAWVRPQKLPKGSTVTLIWGGHREKYGRLLGRVIMRDGEDTVEAIVRRAMDATIGRASPAGGSI